MTNNPWEVPRHDNPMTHATPNPTPAYQHVPLGDGGASWGAPAPSGGYAGGGGAAAYSGPVGPFRKSLWLAIPLAFVFGPLGLFYVGILHGLAAMVVLPAVIPALLFKIAAVTGGGGEAVIDRFAVPLVWAFCIPWAIVGTLLRNAKIDRSKTA